MPVCVRIGKLVFLVLCFLGGLSLCGAGLHRMPPAPRIPQISEKLEQFREGGPFDVVFLGSSKIFRGIVPEVFDAEMQRRGHAVRSFNLGIDGMGFPESAYLLDQLTARDRSALRWVLVELAGVRTALQPAEVGTVRELHWHDGPRTLWVARCILGGEGGAAPCSLLLRHLRLFVRRGLAIGQGSERLLQNGAVEKPQLDPKTRGYAPMPFRLNPASVVQFQSSLARLKTEPPQPGSPASGAVLRQFAQRVGRPGTQVVFFTPPNAMPTRRHHEAGTTIPPPFWAFDEPGTYPALLDLENRADALHLSDPGARAFSVALAERFSRELNSTPCAPTGKGVAR